MCGIAGEIRWNPASISNGTGYQASSRNRAGLVDGAESGGKPATAEQATVRRMLEAMATRGPDDSGVYHDSHATLGCCRLAIVGIDGGRQPMTTPDGRYTIVYNGECYELRPLREQLIAHGVRFRTRTDTEVVLHAYARLGPAALDRLNGMFALAIWDRQLRQLFLARDRFGIKPLFHATLGDRFVFASTLDALAARPDFPTDIDSTAVDLVLATRFIPAPLTIYRQARKLPAGHCAVARAGTFHSAAWWDLPLEPPAARPRSLRASAEQVDQLLERATRATLDSERPVGLCLSGGIDSGLLASYLPRDAARTFSLQLSSPDYDESAAAQHTAAWLGLKHSRIACAADVDGLLQRVVDQLDEPLGDSSALALLSLSEGLRDAVTVLLSGSGGDELFGGYRRHAAILMSRRLGRMPGVLNMLRAVPGQARGGRQTAWSRFTASGAAEPLDCFLRWIGPTSPTLARQLRGLADAKDAGSDPAGELFRRHYDRASALPLVNRLAYLEMKTVLTDDYLVKEDRMTMACSLEGRFPFLDHRLAELAFAMPPRYKVRWLQTKRLLRRLAARRLPAGTARGGKRGFEVPLAQWLRGPLMPRLNDVLLAPSAAIHAYCDPRVIQRVAAEHAAGADHARLLYCLLTLEMWLSGQRPVVRDAPMSGPCRNTRSAHASIPDWKQPPDQNDVPLPCRPC